MEIKWIIKNVLFLVAVFLCVDFVNKVIMPRYGLDPKSFWVGFGILAFVGMVGGIYVFLDNIGYTAKFQDKFEGLYFWRRK